MEDIKSNTPVADALAEVDKAKLGGFAADGSAKRHLTRALWDLAEAVRASLIAFSEGDVRTLAVTALELDYEFDSGDMLTERQREVLDRAHKLFGDKP